MHAQLRSIQLYMAQQRSVAPCGAVRSHAVQCRALRCGAVSLRCVLSFGRRAVPGIMRVVVYGVLLFLFFLFYRLCIRSFTPPCFFPHANYPRTVDQNVTPVTKAHTAQLSTTGQFALHKQPLALSNRCSHPIVGLLFLPPLHSLFLVAFFLALRERSGRRQPPAERSPCTSYIPGTAVYIEIQ